MAGGVVAAGKGDFDNIQLIFEQFVNDFDHALDGHGLFGHDQTAIRIRRCQRDFKRRTSHGIGGGTVSDSLLFVDFQLGELVNYEQEAYWKKQIG